LISDLRTDVGASDLPVFILSTTNNEDLLKIVLSRLDEEDLFKAKKSASKRPVNDADLLKVVVSYMNDELPKVKKSTSKRPYYATVIMAQNRARREIPNVANVHHGKLPVGKDGVHHNAEGQIKLGKMTASAVEEFYKAKE